jgi:outer membrane receptor protein involved in Fe transport
VQSFLTQPVPTGSAFDCAGYFGSTCAAPTPKWRHVMSADWASPWAGLDVTLRWRYIGATDVDRSSNDPQLAATYFGPTSHIGGYTYLDLSASMPVTSGIDFRLGINNITDKAPPIIANGNYSDCPTAGCNDNTWVGTYDTLGRYLYAHVSVKF